MPDIREITGTILIAGEDRRPLTGNECELIRRMLCGEVCSLDEPSADRLSLADEAADDAPGGSADSPLPSVLPAAPPPPGTRVHTPDQNNPTEAARRAAARPGPAPK